MFPFKIVFRATAAAVVGLCLPCSSLAQVNVLTYHNDTARTGANLNETVLTPANVNDNTFGQLFNYAVDGYVYAQPLYVSGLNIPGQGTHNAIFVATEHNSVYCLDADNNTGTNGGVLWQVNLGPSAPCPVDGFRFEAIEPEVGITSTPVIDPVSQTLYLDTFTTDGTNYFHTIHALNLADGTEKSFSPVVVNVSIPATGTGSTNGVLPFQAIQELQRSALTLAGNVLYVAYAGYTDTIATDPFHGWLIGFDATDLQLLPNQIFNSTPNGTIAKFGAIAGEGGIWMGDSGPAVDANNNIYFATGDGNFNAYSGGTEYGDSVLNLSTSNGLSVVDYFTTYNEEYYRTNDLDVGSGGVMLLPDQPGPYPHLMIAAGKPQRAYFLNRDQMTTDNKHFNAGGSSDNIVQTMPLGGGSFDAPAYFDERIYYVGSHDTLRYYVVSNGTLIPDLPGTFASRIYPFPGATPSISASGINNGIAWAIQNGTPAVLVAYNATNLSTEIYNSAQAGIRDQLTNGVKFTVPTVVNGRVYVGGQYEVAVFGLLGGALQFSSTNYTVPNDTNSATITIDRVGGSQGAVQVDYATVPGGTAIPDQDYTSASGTLSWPDGDTSPKTFDITLPNGPPSGTNKTIFLTLSNATGSAYLGGQSNSVLTVGLLGGALQFSSTNYTVPDDTNSATITVDRVGGSQGAVQVDYATVPGGTAIPDQDYTSASGTLSWADGDTSSKTFDITLPNGPPSGTNKTIFLTLSNATGAAYLGGQSNSVLTIGLLGGALQFSSTNYTASENTNSATIAVNRIGGSSGAVQVDYATTSDGTAVPDQDYTNTSGTLSWADGDASPKTFDVALLNGPPAGTNKTIFLTLSNATGGAYLGDQSNSVLTIVEGPYTLWKFDHFGTNASDPDIAGDLADPDHDGIPNILEYAFGSDPNSPDTMPAVTGNIVSNHFQLQFNRNTSATDLIYNAEATPAFDGSWSNLMTYSASAGWVTNTPGATVTESAPSGSPPDQQVQVIITDPVDATSAPASNRFFQINVQP